MVIGREHQSILPWYIPRETEKRKFKSTKQKRQWMDIDC